MEFPLFFLCGASFVTTVGGNASVGTTKPFLMRDTTIVKNEKMSIFCYRLSHGLSNTGTD